MMPVDVMTFDMTTVERPRRRRAAPIVVLAAWLLAATAGACAAPAGSRDEPPARGWVASASPEATQAGLRVLEQGGNAVDAAVAVGFALGVTEPAMSGLGGQTQMLLHRPGRGPLVINGTSFSPAATPVDAVRSDLVGHRATTVPTTVRVLDHAWREHGSGQIGWASLIEPAIAYAERGFAMGPFRYQVLLRHLEDLRASEIAGPLFLAADGSPPARATRWRQPQLARTLRQLAGEGADAFYRGAIARAIGEDMRANGGWMDESDLANLPPPVELEPLRGEYRGHDVFTLPPPGGGWVVLRMLHRLDAIDQERLRPGGREHARLVVQALHDGHLTRNERPVANLTDYAAEVAERIARSESGGETTHYSVVDADGTAVSVTASINAYFGARVAHPELGFLYNDYMREFVAGKPEHPFAVGPGRMPYSSMSPTIVTRDDRPVLVVGSPGSARIISAVVQVIQRWIDGDGDIEQAVAAPRLHAPGDGRLFVEPGAADPLAGWVEAIGLEPAAAADDLASPAGNPYFGGVHALALEDGRWRGAADPRRDGAASFTPPR